jgi:peptidoglycan/xylan/chitin deacetylase (PgdA/CDA1 family)
MPLLAINHHYFRESKTGRGIYPLSSSKMKLNLNALQSKGWKFVTQEGVINFTKESSNTDKLCVITFDDGLKEQIKCIPLLKKFNSRAIFFVSTAPILTNKVLDVHKMHLIRSKVSDEILAESLNYFGFSTFSFDMDALALQYRYDEKLSQKVKYFLNFVIDSEQRNVWIKSLFLEHFSNEAEVSKSLYMDEEDWKFLAKMDCLATHGHEHLPMATLPTEKIVEDIQMSVDIIKDKVGYQVRGIGYPFGGKTAVSNELFFIASKLGLEFGFTMKRGINNCVANPLALDRIDVNDLGDYLT